MAVRSEDNGAMASYMERYLKIWEEDAGPDGADAGPDGAAHKTEAEAALAALRRREGSFTWYVSRTNAVQGVLCIDEAQNKCLLAADSQRAMRDLFRSVPENRTVTCCFAPRFAGMAREYLYASDEKGSGPCYRTGFRGASEYRQVSGAEQAGVIESKKHPVVAEFKEYNSLSGRIKNGRFAVEGMRLVKRALAEGQTVEKVVFTPACGEEAAEIEKLCRDRKIPYFRTSPGIMAAMSSTNPVPEILCSVRMKVCGLEDLMFSPAGNFYLVLDGISNPDNLGIILRTADAAGISGVILLGNSVHFMNKNAIRGARGAMGKLPVFFCGDDHALMRKLGENGFKIIGTSARFQAADFYQIDYTCPNIAVVIGNESDGVRKEILDQCTEYSKIPMADGQSSLNIAVAAALFMYEHMRSNVCQETAGIRP